MSLSRRFEAGCRWFARSPRGEPAHAYGAPCDWTTLTGGITFAICGDIQGVNPSFAGAFHRTGAVEVWGRGTNRVIAVCERHGAAPPTFGE